MSLTLSKSGLVQELTVDNTGENAFDFTTLLHTYFKCADIEHVSVEGLQGSGWTDKVLGDAPKSETRASLKLDGFYDSVYSQTPSTQTIKGLAGKDTPLVVDVEKTNLPDTVVWNPWEENAAKMGDFDDDGFHYMICVEAGAVSERTTLEPNSTWKGSQNIQPHA
ncbi:hypothetical protein SARC_06495 [Sphaeroforma arctica JP610]|uniref:Glucose-6-phosphate 1-epimerase n=1 Tax=Sphaeroforma arctica JP610 TaxID=667725 RepID=A0A0L0FX97_9EUKA|nr:hypothetical protein SARC_06495 [Sphaeroforma arctica JP610]KNC81171.1 hypothetical protein SARC_06495 [Sphaeroforma arctica JP610]|eukprot:XP_014155073.1 hypothetical protein SARC_06495 [Sphaeroforma arctica JP610]